MKERDMVHSRESSEVSDENLEIFRVYWNTRDGTYSLICSDSVVSNEELTKGTFSDVVYKMLEIAQEEGETQVPQITRG